MALDYPNLVEAMGWFDVISETSVLAVPNYSVGLDPVGAYNGLGDYTVSLSEPRGGKIATVTPMSGTFVEGTNIDVDVFSGFPLRTDIRIRVGGVGAAPVELASFTIVVYNLPGSFGA